MDKSHNDIHSNNSKQEINNNKEKEKIVLPKINRESKNIQNNLSDNNNSCHYVKCDIPKINKNNPTFLIYYYRIIGCQIITFLLKII
jgi:hypothetical protein